MDDERDYYNWTKEETEGGALIFGLLFLFVLFWCGVGFLWLISNI